MTEIIQSYSLKFHDESITNPLINFKNNDNNNYYYFGVLSFNITNNTESILKNIDYKKHIHFVFNIDQSGSMDDECKDGRTKMRHIIYTLENMIKVCYEKVGHNNEKISISIYIQTFDSEVTPIITNITDIRDFDKNDLINIIRKISPRGSTNISEALDTASKHIKEYQYLYSENEVVHILLTDGEITCGDFDPQNLKSKLVVNNLCSNIFIGYGKTHDSNLLSILSSVDKGQYRIVDILENAGLVYGEIIHGIFYKILDNIKLYCENEITIYNYLLNEWVNTLEIDALSSEQKKDFQIRYPKDYLLVNSSIILEGLLSNNTNYIYTFKPTIVNEINEINKSNILFEDLTIYLFRQKTQELLFKSREMEMESKKNIIQSIEDEDEDEELFNDKKDKLKQELKELHKIIIEYMKDNKKEKDNKKDNYNDNNNFENNFLKNLADDIYICYKTLGTRYGKMFTYARQISQGKQQTYTCSSINDDSNDDNYKNYYDYSFHDNGNNLHIPMTPFKSIANRKINLTSINDNNNKNCKKGKVGFNPTPFTFVLESETDDNIDIDTYTLSNNILSPYKTNGIMNMMTQMSNFDDDN